MATYHKQNCPLCDNVAEYGWVDRGNRKYFRCPLCGYFQISKRAETLLADYHQVRRPMYATLAKDAPEGFLLVIRMPSPEFRKESNDELQATYVSKSELPLDVH